jgi:hypothetical protein
VPEPAARIRPHGYARREQSGPQSRASMTTRFQVVADKRGDFEPLISEELFYCVQAVLSGRMPSTAPRKRAHPDLPLRGFVRGGSYGRGLTGSWSKGRSEYYAYYHCRPGCRAVHVTKGSLEGLFADELAKPSADLRHKDVAGDFALIEHDLVARHGKILRDEIGVANREAGAVRVNCSHRRPCGSLGLRVHRIREQSNVRCLAFSAASISPSSARSLSLKPSVAHAITSDSSS